jgi:hypothetical protein
MLDQASPNSAPCIFISHEKDKEEAYTSDIQFSHGLVLLNVVTWLLSERIHEFHDKSRPPRDPHNPTYSRVG